MRAPSDARILRLLLVSQWIALVLGIVPGVLGDGGTPLSFAAAASSGIYVLVTTALPVTVLRKPLVMESTALMGSLLTMVSVVLTGGVQSPYVLLSVMPPVLATVLGGFRIGVATATLNGALLVAVSLAEGTASLAQSLGTAFLYLVVALTVAQIRRLLADMEVHASQLEATSAETSRRLELLESTHELLNRLVDVTSKDIGAIGIGKAALESLAASFPGSSGLAMMNGSAGPVVVARHGVDAAGASRSHIPLVIGGREVGNVILATPEPLTDEQERSLEAALYPLALSFANVILLQEIAHNAVQEERVRLARELHDEIGPSLASLGLSLDVAVLEADPQPILVEHLLRLRGAVTDLVEDVRTTVADLRSDGRGSLTLRLHDLVAALSAPPEVMVEIDERRPPRPSMIDDLAGLLGEAIRNAHRHSGGNRVRVRGWVDFNRGSLAVEDDGVGFDPASPYDGHYGLVGMRERAHRMGARLGMTSGDAGTSVRLEWGEP